jgi:hypothetical protein
MDIKTERHFLSMYIAQSFKYTAEINRFTEEKFMARLKDPYYQNRDLFKELNIKL